MKFTLKSLFLSLFTVFSLSGVTPTITHLGNSDSGLLLPANVFLVHDFHLDYQGCEISLQQKKDLIAVAQRLGAYVIGESTFDYLGDNQAIKKRLDHIQSVATRQQTDKNKGTNIITSPAVLSADLICDCKKQDIPCFNVEFRQAVDASLNNVPVMAFEIRETFYARLQMIQNQLDEIKLNYGNHQQVKELVEYALGILKKVELNAKSMMDYFKENARTLHDLENESEFAQYKENLSFFDLELMDLNILLELFKQRDQKSILIFVGNQHAKNVIHFLKNYWHYQQFNEVQEDYSGADYQIVLNNCIDVSQYFESIVLPTSENMQTPKETQQETLWAQIKQFVAKIVNFFN